jgi:hypothetical protein
MAYNEPDGYSGARFNVGQIISLLLVLAFLAGIAFTVQFVLNELTSAAESTPMAAATASPTAKRPVPTPRPTAPELLIASLADARPDSE